MVRTATYCTSTNISDWLRIPINPNTDPNTSMVNENIMDNEDRIDRLTGHTWLENKQVTEEYSVNKL
jgi:hypothetical protein